MKKGATIGLPETRESPGIVGAVANIFDGGVGLLKTISLAGISTGEVFLATEQAKLVPRVTGKASSRATMFVESEII